MNRHRSARLQDARELGDHARVVVDMLDDVESQDDVEASVAKRQAGCVGGSHGPDSSRAYEGQRVGASIAGHHVAETTEVDSSGAGAAAHVQSPDARRAQAVGKQLLEEQSLAREPPVVGLDFVHGGEVAELHDWS